MTIWHSLVTSIIISTSLTVMTHNGQQDIFILKKCELWVFLDYHLFFSFHTFHTLKFSLMLRFEDPVCLIKFCSLDNFNLFKTQVPHILHLNDNI